MYRLTFTPVSTLISHMERKHYGIANMFDIAMDMENLVTYIYKATLCDLLMG